MTDPLRSDRQPQTGDVPDRDREVRIEELLLSGLNHYFADQYELAINVWTRVLFIDRGHARARAYIERARSAIAERQRRGDELLHTSSAALDRGDATGARELVNSAVDHGASSEDALALLARIERLESAGRPGPRSPARHSPAVDRHHSGRPRVSPWRWVAASLLAGILLGAGAILFVAQPDGGAWPLLGPPPEGPQPVLGAPVPVPTSAEVVLTLAESLQARGRLHEALEALASIPSGDPLRARADQVAAAIQQQLLAAARNGALSGPDPLVRRP